MKEIGKFCALAKKNTLVYPKNIPGYKSPDPQKLTENKQQMLFVYDPIEYKISYDLDGGYHTAEEGENYKNTFTVEDEAYIPPTPHKNDCVFSGWNITRISSGEKLSNVSGIGDVKCTATWMDNAILVAGGILNKTLDDIAGGKENIIAIQRSPELIVSDYYNLSSTKTPIFAKYDSGILYIYCKSTIYCNPDMKGAFKDMLLLRDISALKNFICPKNANISELCSGCALLSDLAPVENWANGQFSDFTGAFDGTSALSAGRVPEWYRWNVRVNYMSSNGSKLDASDEVHIPGETVYPKAFAGYKAFTTSIVIDSKDKEYTFIYEPISYKLSYIVDGKENTKISAKSYTIEDVDYYPPELSKEGYTFSGWSPECIRQGEYGDVTFIATFNKI